MDPADRLAAELAVLAGQDVAGLRGRFRRVFGHAAPAHLSRVLLHRVLAHRVQATALGDLPRETTRRLERLARGEDDAIALPALRSTRPGTLLVREWQGELHRVVVLEAGYAWNGRPFTSLSEVAFAITGTRWSGPRFFGLGSKDPETRARPRSDEDLPVSTPALAPANDVAGAQPMTGAQP